MNEPTYEPHYPMSVWLMTARQRMSFFRWIALYEHLWGHRASYEVMVVFSRLLRRPGWRR